ncbi:MAG: hypothetical protein WCC90_20515, partial [Methylocella sp.]
GGTSCAAQRNPSRAGSPLGAKLARPGRVQLVAARPAKDPPGGLFAAFVLGPNQIRAYITQSRLAGLAMLTRWPPR